jgi:hypothetical protein
MRQSGRFELSLLVGILTLVVQTLPAMADGPAATRPGARDAIAPTGVEPVDTVIAAVQGGDAAALARLVRLSEIPCGPETPEGFALVPTCAEGEAEGTPVAVFPAAACEPYWARDPLPTLNSFVQEAGPLHAVVRGPEPPPADTLVPAAEYLVIFAPRPGSFVWGLAAYIQGGELVSVQAGCNTPDVLMHGPNGEPLPVVFTPTENPAGEAPAPPTAPSTELPAVDAAVAAVLAGDTKTLAGMVGYEEVECWSGSPGMGAPPLCEALGLRPGTWLQTLPVGSCEVSFAPKWEVPTVLSGLLTGEALPFAGVFEPAAHPFSSEVERPEYGVVFEGPGGAGYRALYLRGDRVVAVTTGCGMARLPDALVQRWVVQP